VQPASPDMRYPVPHRWAATRPASIYATCAPHPSSDEFGAIEHLHLKRLGEPMMHLLRTRWRWPTRFLLIGRLRQWRLGREYPGCGRSASSRQPRRPTKPGKRLWLQEQRSPSSDRRASAFQCAIHGGATGTRTPNPLLANYTFCALWHSAACRLRRPKAGSVLWGRRVLGDLLWPWLPLWHPRTLWV
jgi:hypothetical protein